MVVFPEKETGVRFANNLIMGNFFDAVELSSTFSLIECDPLKDWIGKSLKELNLRARYKVNVIAIKRYDEINVTPDANEPIEADDVMIFIGQNEYLNNLQEIKKR